MARSMRMSLAVYTFESVNSRKTNLDVNPHGDIDGHVVAERTTALN